MPRDVVLTLFTVYRDPKDLPGLVVVRRHWISRTRGSVTDCGPACVYATATAVEWATALKEWAAAAGLTWVPRDPCDDPTILGSFL